MQKVDPAEYKSTSRLEVHNLPAGYLRPRMQRNPIFFLEIILHCYKYVHTLFFSSSHSLITFRLYQLQKIENFHFDLLELRHAIH